MDARCVVVCTGVGGESGGAEKAGTGGAGLATVAGGACFWVSLVSEPDLVTSAVARTAEGATVKGEVEKRTGGEDAVESAAAREPFNGGSVAGGAVVADGLPAAGTEALTGTTGEGSSKRTLAISF